MSIEVDHPAMPDSTRRKLFRKVTGASAALFTGLATLSADDAEAYPYRCCHLASNKKCNNCHGPGTNFHCPSGYHAVSWHCCGASNKIIGCGECVPNSSNTCYQGPFKCSCGWWFGTYC